jgi:hypothetical protein
MSLSKVRGFLLQLPKPASLRVMINGEPSDVKLGRSWQKTSESLMAMGAEQIIAIDAGGAVLRAMRLDTEDARRSEAAPIPPQLANDPNAALLSMFADRIHRAYEHSTEIAFTKLVELADRLGGHIEGIEARLARTEARLARAHDDLLQDAFERAEELQAKGEEGGFGDQLAQAFFSGQLQRRAPTVHAAAQASQKANGAAKPNGHKTTNGKGRN